ncbi:MAG: hypothetical protein U0792_24805 [Gemmataceae bacterium]
MNEWAEWASGDYVHAPDGTGAEVTQTELLRRVSVGFRRVAIDWPEGERWAEARAIKAAEVGYRGFLLEAEQSLRRNSVLVSVADASGPDAVWMRFYLTVDAGCLELNYHPATAVAAGRTLAAKLAELLGYEFSPLDGNGDAVPDSTTQRIT